jgi:hypothetical protein
MRILSTMSVDSCRGFLYVGAIVTACLPTSLLCHCTALRLVLAYRAWAHARCASQKVCHRLRGSQVLAVV